MFFVLSKTVDFLAMPFTWVIVCVVMSAFIRKPVLKQRLLWVALVLLLLFSNHFLANEAMSAWEIKTIPYDQLRSHKLAIVLTGSTLPDRYPEDRVYFARGADRVIHTVQLYKLGKVENILISGGTGRLVGGEEPEADKFKKSMILMGVPDSVIMLENETRNTYESAVAVKPMLDSMHFSSSQCLLVTSAFHMRRSLACYRKAGLDIEPFSTDFYSNPRSFYPNSLLIPQLDAFSIWQKLFKEWVGMLAYKAAGYI
ncbi:YdcF family protein [Chryseolinea sp. T2]|uniref:YdcF family protein n=1 Tax=Chryseolinea sp. T2 TaxID=3129255 RepID=UPI0030770997